MAAPLDPNMLASVVQAVQAFMPTIRRGIEAFQHDPQQRDALEDAYEAMHRISDAALLLDVEALDHLATCLETAFEDLAAAPMARIPAHGTWLQQALDQLEAYLARLVADDPVEAQAIVTAVLAQYAQFTNRMTEAASPPPAVAPGPDISAELLEGFLAEADDYLNTIGRALPELRLRPDQRDLLQTVRRCVHTLKGASGMVGLMEVSHLTHRMEDLLDGLYDGQMPWTPAVHELLVATFDVLDAFFRDQGAQGLLDPSTTALYRSYATLLGDASVDDAAPMAADDTKAGSETPAEPEPTPLDTESPASRPLTDLVRVPLTRVDELVRLVSELVISRSVYEQHLGHLSHQMDELRLSMDRLRRVATQVETSFQNDSQATAAGVRVELANVSPLRPEFDELEFERYNALQLLSRELNETTADFGALEQEFGNSLGDFESYLTRHGRLTSEIQDKLMRLRMVPLATLGTRLHRAVRVTARQQGKEVALHLVGEAVEFDKTVLEEMAEPLLHLLRNAVDHGIEPPEVREDQGKPRGGQIRLHAYAEGTQVILQVSDDGAGLSPQRLRDTAVRRGFLTAEDASQLTVDQAHHLVFLPGLSTARELSEISGRGVGMDIVQATVSRLKGSVELTSTPGQGMRCTMRLPLTLAIMRVLLVTACDATFALPLADIVRVLRLDTAAIEHVGQAAVMRVDDAVVPVMALGDRLHLRPTAAPRSGVVPVVITQSGEQRVALMVDQLLGGREVVVKTLGNHLRRVPGIMGSTLMGDGRIVLILHVSELLRGDTHPSVPRSAPRAEPSPRVVEVPEVLIVDDSLSVRRVVANLIRSAGWHPLTAKDGVEALDLIQRAARLPDIILMDIEMPHMDGYELTSTLRAHATYRDIPIVMLTSRAGEKHRQKAFEVGVTEYLVKPYQDEILLTLIRRLAPRAEGSTAV